MGGRELPITHRFNASDYLLEQHSHTDRPFAVYVYDAVWCVVDMVWCDVCGVLNNPGWW